MKATAGKATAGKATAGHALVLTLILLGGCKPRESAQPTDTSTTTAASGTVERERIDATPTPVPAPVTQAVIQTQPGPNGTQVALNKLAVTGDIMTVQLTYTGGDKSVWQTPSIEQVSIVDDATAQKIGVLKDGQGQYMASPINSGVKSVLGFNTGEGPKIVWFKVPAPPATSKTVSVNIPDVVPFDGVPVTR